MLLSWLRFPAHCPLPLYLVKRLNRWKNSGLAVVRVNVVGVYSLGLVDGLEWWCGIFMEL
jgi:hypothetical protein